MPECFHGQDYCYGPDEKAFYAEAGLFQTGLLAWLARGATQSVDVFVPARFCDAGDLLAEPRSSSPWPPGNGSFRAGA